MVTLNVDVIPTDIPQIERQKMFQVAQRELYKQMMGIKPLEKPEVRCTDMAGHSGLALPPISQRLQM